MTIIILHFPYLLKSKIAKIDGFFVSFSFLFHDNLYQIANISFSLQFTDNTVILFDYISNIIYTVTRKGVVPMKLIKKIKNLTIKRRTLPLLLAVAFLATVSPASLTLYAVSPTASATNILSGLGAQDAPQRPATMSLEITGQIPTANTGSSQLDSQLEERWTTQLNNFVQSHMASALSINSTVEHFASGRYVSTVFIKEAVSVSTTTVVSTTVIDTSGNNRIIALTDVDVNILQLINNYINAQVAARPHNFSSFSGIDANHPFYMDGDRLVIPFGSAELVSTDRGVHNVTLSRSDIQSVTFNSEHFRILPPSQYSTIMVRVSSVMGSFDYDVRWDNDLRAAIVSKDGRIVSILTIGENSYQYDGGRARELEVAPMLHNDLTYVPLSFFNEVVGIPTTVSSSGVTASRYNFDSGVSGGNASYRVLP